MTKGEGKTIRDEADRTEMMKKMDGELEEHFAALEARAAARGERGKDPEGWTEENWEEEMASHPFFNQGWKEGEELSPLMQGMQDLKYSPDENTPEELANNYKEDGNFNFKCKKYRFATASYTEGLRVACGIPAIDTALLTNRAAAQYHVGNYRSSLRDCGAALALSPAHLKAVVRAALCCSRLARHQQVVEWADRGLQLEQGHEELARLRTESLAKIKQVERDLRKGKLAERKRKEEGEAVEGGASLGALQPALPQAEHRRVRLEEGALVWPVLLLYPEVGETDFIEEFREGELLGAHLEVMLGEGVERPGWDQQASFLPSTVLLYFEDSQQRLVEVQGGDTLLQAITRRGFMVKGGVPAFMVLVRGSPFTRDFLAKYTIVK